MSRVFIGGKEAIQTEFPIEDGIPPPDTIRDRNGDITRLGRTLAKLEVGQSTVVPIDPKSGRAIVSVYNATKSNHVFDDRKFRQRKVQPELGDPFIRIWRIE
jgi:hypothetical protein